MVSSNTNICFITLGALSASCLTFTAIFTVFWKFVLVYYRQLQEDYWVTTSVYTCSEVNINKISISFIQHTHTQKQLDSLTTLHVSLIKKSFMSDHPPNCLYGTTWLRLNRFSWNLRIFFKKTVQKIRVWLKPDKNTRYYTKTCVHLW